MTAVRRAIIATSVLALTASACGSGSTEADKSLRDRIQVSGDFGEPPEIKIDAPLKLAESSSWIEEKGDGDSVGEDATAILELTLANGRTGKTSISTLDQGKPLEVKLGNQVFPSLNSALVGKPADSRIVVASVPDDAYGDNGSPQNGIEGGDPVVMVADIVSTDPSSALEGPTGDTLAAPATAPRIREKDGVPARLAFGKLAQAQEARGDPTARGAPARRSRARTGSRLTTWVRSGAPASRSGRRSPRSRPSSPSGSVASYPLGTRPWTARRRAPG